MSILYNEVINVSFKLTWRSRLFSILVTIAFFLSIHRVVGTIIFNYVSQSFISSGNLVVNFGVSIVLLTVLNSIVYNLIRGTVYKFFGGKVTFGFKGIYAYIEETSGISLIKADFLIVLLAPLVIISCISLLLPVWLGSVLLILNFIGSLKDISRSFALCKFSYDIKIIGMNYGFDVVDD